jgi:hypothetical protein
MRMLERLEAGALARLREWARASRPLSLPEALSRGAAITAELVRTPEARRRWAAFTTGDAPWI